MSSASESTLVLPGGSRAKLSDFDVGRVIGEGGMAVVHQATHIPTQRRVALKKMKASAAAGDPTFVERFVREARAVARLNHPNICEIIGVNDEEMFIAFELIDGGSVRDLKRVFGGKLPVELTAIIVDELLAALHAAHEGGVIHRDLKPGNLMLTKSGMVKLVDFGIARSVGDATLTAKDMLIGTPAFMSPEQVEGKLTIDGRSDLFSAGLVLHDLVVGKSPFMSDNPATSLMRVLKEEVPLLFDDVPAVPAALEELHAALTEKKRDRRPATADDARELFADYIQEVRTREPNLLARAIADPAGVRLHLISGTARKELERGLELVKRHGPNPAAILALQNAVALEPTLVEAQRMLEKLGVPVASAESSDPRIVEAESALKDTPTSPGILKRLADLHRAGGDARKSASFLLRYLRSKDDAAGRQQLVSLLVGPNAEPAQVSKTVPRLQTVDIVAGVKTGGLPRRSSPASSQIRVVPDLTTKLPSGEVHRLAESRPEVRRFDVAPPRIQVAGMSPLVWLTPLVVGALIVWGIRNCGPSGLVPEKAPVVAPLKDPDQMQQYELAQSDPWPRQRQAILEAESAILRRDAGTALQRADFAMEGRRSVGIVVDALIVRAKAEIMLGDSDAARGDLDEVLRNINITDTRVDELRAMRSKLR